MESLDLTILCEIPRLKSKGLKFTMSQHSWPKGLFRDCFFLRYYVDEELTLGEVCEIVNLYTRKNTVVVFEGIEYINVHGGSMFMIL